MEKRVVVEVDGGQHAEQLDYDSKRDSWLRAEGFSVLRFWDNEVLTQVENVKQVISDALSAPLQFAPATGAKKIEAPEQSKA